MDSSPSAARFTATRTGTALRLLLLLLALVSPWTVNDCHAQQPPLLERLTQELLDLVMANQSVLYAEVEVDKPHALRFAESVSITLAASR